MTPKRVQKSDLKILSFPTYDGLKSLETINPSMVSMARQAMGLTQKEFCEKIGVAQSTLSKLEDGLLSGIDNETMVKLVNYSGHPPAFFQRCGGQRPLRETFFRKRSTISLKLLKQCEALINIRSLEVEALLDKAEIDPRRKLPSWAPDEFIGGPREIARHLRSMWGIPRGPVIDLIAYIEDAGVVVVPFDFGTIKIDGVSMTTFDGAPILFYNAKAPAARQRLTIAHELGHIVMHTIPTSGMEDEAFEFAAEFLMPEMDIRGSLFPLDLDKLIRLKSRWCVSMQAILRWAKQIGAMKESYYKYLMMKISQAGWRTCEPLDDTIEAEKPQMLADLVQLYLKDLNYSEEQLCALLKANVHTFAAQYLGRPQLRAI